MGLTIHYHLELRNAEALRPLVDSVRAFAAARGWPIRAIEEAHVTLTRPTDEEDSVYEGPSAGVEVLPDEYCDPVRLEFGNDLIASDFTKTQFAGADVHQEVVRLFDALQPYLARTEIVDESEYWETRDPRQLDENLATCRRMIHEALAMSPHARGPIRLASGRWADIVT